MGLISSGKSPKPLNWILNYSRKYSLWMFQWGLACCAIEMGAALAGPRYDVMRLGVIPFPASPRQADLIVISGTVTDKMAPAIKRLYEQMPDPKYVISMGSCANCGGPYWDSYSVTKGVDQIIPVDVYVPGLPAAARSVHPGHRAAAAAHPERGHGRALARRGAGADRRWLTPTDDRAPTTRRAGAPALERERSASRRCSRACRPSSATRSSSTRRCYGDVVVRVQPDAWRRAAQVCKEQLECDYLSFVAGIDWMPTPARRRGRLGRHVGARAAEGTDVRRRRQRRPLPSVRVRRVDAPPALARDPQDRRRRRRLHVESWVSVYPGADWHEREAWEMYGFVFDGHPSLRHLYLPSEFEGHPLRKDFPLLAREVKPWPGLVDVEPMPGEPTTTKRRTPRAEVSAA